MDINNPAYDMFCELTGHKPEDECYQQTPDGIRHSARWDVTRPHSFTLATPRMLRFMQYRMSGNKWFDPMCGTGYWAFVLKQLNIDMVSSDLCKVSDNYYHRPKMGQTFKPWVNFAVMDAVEAVAVNRDRCLFLSWPPYDNEAGANVIKAYEGPLIMYVGELEGGCCGDGSMWESINENWWMVASQTSHVWYGLHDGATLYSRKQ